MSHRRRSQRGTGRGGAIVAALLVLVGVLAAGTLIGRWYLFDRIAVEIEPGIPVEITVPEGASTTKIAEILASEGVVPNALTFRLLVREVGADGKLRAGVYELETGMDGEEVIRRMSSAPKIVYTDVTIPEGFTLEQIVARFEKDAGIPASELHDLATSQAGTFDYEFLDDNPNPTLEGYLFPKTYRVREGATARDVIVMMLDQFQTETKGLDLSFPSGKGLDMHEFVTVASMIEREAQLAKERPLVASVIYNRLDKNMRLQLCATLEYVLPGNKPRLTAEDLELDSPYNTYLYGGLTPGPIASPGLASLQAAAQPASTDHLYYVLTGEDGSHTFTSSYDEFLKAKERSREVVP